MFKYVLLKDALLNDVLYSNVHVGNTIGVNRTYKRVVTTPRFIESHSYDVQHSFVF